MSRHVPPHRFADAAAGRLPARAIERDRRHAARCSRCAGARDRVLASREAMAEVAAAAPPELGWDHIGARIHWSTSRQQRAAARRGRPAWRWAAGAGVLAVGAVAALTWTSRGRAPAPRAELPAEVTAPAPAPEPAPPAALAGVVTFAAGEVALDGAPLAFDRLLGPGSVLRTGDGRVGVQFAAGSGFALAPGSELRVLAFDERRIELAVSGEVDVDVTRRRPGQSLAIVAGDHRVVVRGTAFRVGHRDGELEVTCTRGKVVVTGGAEEVDVRAGERFRVVSEAFSEAALRSVPLSPEERQILEQSLRVPLLPAFPGARALLDTTSALEVEAAADRSITVDGVAIGEGSFQLRVMRGRHHVAADGDEGAWIETAAARDRTVVAPPPSPTPSAPGRRRELAEAVEAGDRVHRCLEPLAKHGLVEGSYAVFDVGIAADGSQAHLNVLDSNLSPAIQRCLRQAVDAVQLPAGAAARFRYRLAF